MLKLNYKMFQAIISWLLNLIPKPKIESKKAILFILLSLIFVVMVYFAVRLYKEGWRPKLVIENNTIGVLFTKKSLGTNAEASGSADSIAPQASEIKPLPSGCPPGYLCSDFSDDDFSGWGEYARSGRNPRLLSVSSDSVFDNPPLLFRKDSTGINFEMTLQATPRNNKTANIVLLYYKVWRCTIGEANFNTISCKSKYDDPNSPVQKPQFLSSNGKLPISPNNDIFITIKSALTNKNKNILKITLNYIDSDGNKSDIEFEYIFNLPSPDVKNFKQLVGVGIIDPNKDNVQDEFKSFKLLKRDLL